MLKSSIGNFGKNLLLILLFFSGFSFLSAQSSQAGAKIVWMDNPEEITIRNSLNREIVADFGIMLGSGYTIQTANSSAEIVLVPNGSVIVINENTNFRIDSIRKTEADEAATQNTFSLLKGKLRFIAAKISGSSYSVNTQSAVAGVRGTDFYRMYDPETGKDWLCVTEGSVQFDSPDGKLGVLVPAGSFVNLNNGFQTAQPDEDWLNKNLTLEKLNRAVLPDKQ